MLLKMLRFFCGMKHVFLGCEDYLDSYSCEVVSNNCKKTCKKCNYHESSSSIPDIISTTTKPTKPPKPPKTTTKKPFIPHTSVIWGELRKKLNKKFHYNGYL